MVKLIVEKEVEITGRGIMIIISVIKNKLIYWKKLQGALIEYKEEPWRVISIETTTSSNGTAFTNGCLGLFIRKEEPRTTLW